MNDTGKTWIICIMLYKQNTIIVWEFLNRKKYILQLVHVDGKQILILISCYIHIFLFILFA